MALNPANGQRSRRAALHRLGATGLVALCALLAHGAQAPAEKPVMQGADRWPAIAVGVAVAVNAGFVAFVWITLG